MRNLSDASRQQKELTARLQGVQFVLAHTESLKTMAVEQQKAIDLARAAFEAADAGRQNQMDILASQADLAQYAFQRRDIERELAKLSQQEELDRQAFITRGHGYTVEQEDIAQKRIVALRTIYANDDKAAQRHELEVSYADLSSAVESMAQAIGQHDWQAATKKFFEALTTAAHAFSLAGSRADQASAVGGLMGSVGTV